MGALVVGSSFVGRCLRPADESPLPLRPAYPAPQTSANHIVHSHLEPPVQRRTYHQSLIGDEAELTALTRLGITVPEYITRRAGRLVRLSKEPPPQKKRR